MPFTIALVGNPNCGKTTLFNALTGAHQKVGNWPGVTVERKSGRFKLGDSAIEVVDLPGIYSIEQTHMGLDEKIARQALETDEFDLIINILDASNLQRSLVLTQQLMDGDQPLIVAINMLDVAKQDGIVVDAKGLEERLKIPVVEIIASRKVGITELRSRLSENLAEQSSNPQERNGIAQDSPAIDLPKRYHQSQILLNGVVEVTPIKHTRTEKIDRWVLNRFLGIPFFLSMMYLMFTIAINVGAIFIDFFDILFASVFVDGIRWLLTEISAPIWITTLLADGLGGGITLVATFIPVIGVLYLCLSVLEDSGYMSRAAFVIDRLMAKIGLPGNAFVPLIVGFGCNVPSVMATRSLSRDSDRLLTIAMAPFMSCGARLTVYALFAAAFFTQNGQNIVFLLYFLGMFLAVMTGWIFRRQLFEGEAAPSLQEMPAYHAPVLRNILLTTWFRLKGFMFRAGKTIVAVVVVLSMLNSIGTDGSFGNEDSQESVLSVIGKQITPVFSPMGIEKDNWPATVGLFTGMFAKEAIVGTLDALYSEVESSEVDSTGAAGEETLDDNPAPDILGATQEAFGSIANAFMDLTGALTDPLGISIGDVEDTAAAAEDQGVQGGTLTSMATLFSSGLAAFCYLVFILLYAPCVAVLGAINKEAGWRWMVIVFSWSTGLAYLTATIIYQVGTFSQHPLFSSMWLLGSVVASILAIASLKSFGKRATSSQLVQVIQLPEST